MALRKIARLGHPVLLARAAPVADARAHDVARLIEDMVETLLDADGLGLAAPQVHESVRLILVREGAEREDAAARPPTVLINPEIEPLDDEIELGIEGCLSIPELRGLVPRARRVRYRALDADGRPLEGIALGLHARILQHEVDHLDGILFPMRMPDLRWLALASELHHLQAALRAEEEAS